MKVLPQWAESAVFYEIYPQTFFDTNGDGIGDLQGVIAKLDYVKSLGCDAIWLNPFYQSPMRDAGYDVEDFCAVAPRYGTLDDARALFVAAHEKGLRVIVDLVPGHTAETHPWFQASIRGEEPYRDWYIWTDTAWDNGGKDFAGKFVHGTTPRDGNFMINFFAHQPALNFGFGQPDQSWQLSTTHPNVRKLWDEMQQVQRFWLEQGADGFRIDMAGSITRKDKDSTETRRFWEECRNEVWGEDTFTVAEWSWPATALDGKGLHSDFLHWIPSYENLFRKGQESADSWFHQSGKGDLAAFLKDYDHHYQKTNGKGVICIPCGNHDLPRISTGRDTLDLEIVHAFLLTMPGVPFLYYGDEIGMRQLPSQPYDNREGCYGTRAGARTPMQWEDGPSLGFSTAPADHLWANLDRAAAAPTVAAQQPEPASLLNRMRTLIDLRRSEPALRASAGFTVLHCEPKAYPFVFLRTAPTGERVVVVLNPAARPFQIEVDVPGTLHTHETLRTIATTATVADGKLKLTGTDSGYGIFKC